MVVPLRDKAATIARALASIFAQTAPPAEVLVVDDASSDDGPARAAGFAGVRLLRRATPGPGGYAARNLAIKAARSRWIAFLDADDFWLPQHLAQLQAAAGGARGAVGAFSARFNVHGAARTRDPAPEGLPALQALGPAVLLDAWLRARDCPVWTGAAMFQRAALLEAGLFPEGRPPRGGDKDLWLRLLLHGPLVYTGEATACFDRAADDKLTQRVSTARAPILCETIAAMRARRDQAPGLRRRLERLANLEIRLYARQCFARAVPPAAMRRALYLPGGLADWAVLAVLERVPPALLAPLRAALRPSPDARATRGAGSAEQR